jgi:hypothetical protein
VAEGVIEGGAKYPILIFDIPLGPSVAGDEVRAARIADESHTLAVVRHLDTLPLPNRRSKMAGKDWSEVVEEAVRRHVAHTGDPVFTRQELIDAELDRIVSETGSQGATPHMTLSRELQQLRDAGVLEFVDDRGTYRLIG